MYKLLENNEDKDSFNDAEKAMDEAYKKHARIEWLFVHRKFNDDEHLLCVGHTEEDLKQEKEATYKISIY